MPEYEYLVAPGTQGRWVSYDELVTGKLARWLLADFGAPSITISKRVKGETCGDTHILVTDTGNVQYVCARSKGHTFPHRDTKQKGTETVSWWGAKPTR